MPGLASTQPEPIPAFAKGTLATWTAHGFDVLATAGPAIEARVASLAEALAAIDPAAGREVMVTRVGDAGEVQRWRPHRAAIVFRAPPLGPSHVKIWQAKDALDAALSRLLRSRAQTSWTLGRALRDAGI